MNPNTLFFTKRRNLKCDYTVKAGLSRLFRSFNVANITVGKMCVPKRKVSLTFGYRENKRTRGGQKGQTPAVAALGSVLVV